MVLAALLLTLASRAIPSPTAPGFLPFPAIAEQQDVESQLAHARRREARGDLAQAREAWLGVAPRLPLGPERDAAVGAARAIEDRLAIREEVRAFAAAVPGAFDALGLGPGDEDWIEFGGERMPWVEVDIDVLRRAVKIAKGSARAKRGLVQEALARGTPAEKRAALTDLARMFEKGEMPPVDAFAAVARARGEDLPAGGYVLVKGTWRRTADEARAAESAALEEAALTFEDAEPKSRDAALAKLEARGPEGVARAAQVLGGRWKGALAALQRGTVLEQLEHVAAQRTDLDQRRAAALKLIFDEERYFYPYNPPECPPERAKLYAGVQQEVDGLVEAVRETWRAPKRARLSSAFRAGLEEIAWSRGAQAARKLAFAWDAGLPAWIEAIDPSRDVVDLTSFALDAREAADLARDRAVIAFNEAAWKRAGTDGVGAPNAEERRQVEITNAYRAMLGRRVLAWNPKIQAAAQKHADYMSLTGDFGHFEPDPARHAPEDRLKAEGYALGGSENCHAGDSGAEGAHVGWTHSSGHHRNLLIATHREMASGIAGPYWCQNFGAGREFEAQLELKPAR
ncbi:MAG: CAP domain-containing protein [Planctomycetota bacterium]|nr:CAP domain-containing protein [Planctomycetota bacterium]